MPPPLILVAEDEPAIRETLCDELSAAGYRTIPASDGQHALDQFESSIPDLVLTDLAMPRNDGFRVIQAIRARHATPIIVLSVLGGESDKIRALDLGADDYVTKPFSVAELMARIKAIFRRQARMASHDETFKVGEWEVNPRKHVMARGRTQKRLSFYEVELLKFLGERSEEAVARDELLEKIWGVQPTANNRTVDNFIVKLRRKFEEDNKNPRHILTVYGFGYKLVP